ncbi:hypothetical protein SUGI_1140060 [Cryptomeria japonica]|nr:hypothetical protein SUGI_1140060 [Cryptomeria japonica]
MHRRFQGFQQFGYGRRFKRNGYRMDYNTNRARTGGGGSHGENFKHSSWAESIKPEIDTALSEDIEEDIALWSEMAEVVLKFIPKGFFIVIFREETGRARVLNQQNWTFGSAHLYLQPWQPNFDPVPLGVYKEPIWIWLYNLLMEYWGEAILECIGRSLGTLLEVDEDIIENDSYLYARIKIVAVKKVPTVIFLKAGVRQWKQQVEVEVFAPCRGGREAMDLNVGIRPSGRKSVKKWVQIVG